MTELQSLHRHLHNTSGPEAWTARLLRLFRAAAETPESEEEMMFLDAEPPQTFA